MPKFGPDPDKLALAKQLYVKDGKSIVYICTNLDVSMNVLDALRKEEHWDDLKKTAKVKAATEDTDNPLAIHERALEQQGRIIMTLLYRMAETEIDWETAKKLRYEVVTATHAAEALHLLIEDGRSVYGVGKGKPSVARDTQGEDGVQYVVALPPKKEEPVEQVL